MKDAPFDPATIRALADILAETGLTEIEVEAKDLRIRVARAHAPAANVIAPVTAHAPASAAMPSAPPPALAPAALAAQDDASHPGMVPSPMVGIVYLAPEPGLAPFVTVGQTVAAGQTLLLIEAMKTFNQIRAPRAGTVTRILVTSGAPVEYGEPLLVLE